MDGDIAPMGELAHLRQKHGFLWVLDDAHGTFAWGKNGGGLAEEFNCEYDVDLCVGTLSKAASSLGGFVACSKIWKQWIQSRGRSFFFSTIAPIPLVAASYVSICHLLREFLQAGFYCVAVGPPAVPPKTARIRLTLTAVQTTEDIKRLAALISKYVKFQVPSYIDSSNYTSARL
ncbi:hypothetical protein V6N12_043923 [Hibiscus sabdariffa]